jgi:hypothetical protein
MPTLEVSSSFEEKLLEEAIQSPALAMIRISMEVDRQLRLILAAIGKLRSYTGPSPIEALDLIWTSQTDARVPSALRDTLRDFWELRNKIVHGNQPNEALTVRAVDYGIRILKMVQSIPRPRYVVTAIVTLYADQACTRVRPDIRGVLLDYFGPGGESRGQLVFPTRKDYLKGQSVSWEWETSGSGWGETWFRDPRTQIAKCAWSESAEFAGRPLDEI